MYFSFYPKVAYKIDEYDYVKSIDITTSVKLKNYIKTYKGILYNPYTVINGERPDHIAFKVYGSEKYDWVIMLVNEIEDINEDWPKSSKDFDEFIISKYGSIQFATNTFKVYYDSHGNVIDETTYLALPSNQKSADSIYQYETKLNDAKSKIKLISPALISTIETDARKILRGSV